MNSVALPARLYSLDVLRGIAALSVVVFHWRHFFYDGVEPGSDAPPEQPLLAALFVPYRAGWQCRVMKPRMWVLIGIALASYAIFRLTQSQLARGAASFHMGGLAYLVFLRVAHSGAFERWRTARSGRRGGRCVAACVGLTIAHWLFTVVLSRPLPGADRSCACDRATRIRSIDLYIALAVGGVCDGGGGTCVGQSSSA